jgi:hypothetical protein
MSTVTHPFDHYITLHGIVLLDHGNVAIGQFLMNGADQDRMLDRLLGGRRRWSLNLGEFGTGDSRSTTMH